MPRHGMGAQAIYALLKDQMMAGCFTHDGRLPSSRALAYELGVSRTTVTVAYEQLVAEGFITVRQGARPEVIAEAITPPSLSSAMPNAAPPVLSRYAQRITPCGPPPDEGLPSLAVDFRYGQLAPEDFPRLAWKRALNATLVRQRAPSRYASPCGTERLRKALHGYLRRARGLRCDIDQLIVVNGSQQGLDLCARLLLNPEDSFVVESPCYAMARQVFASTGATGISVRVDAQGMQTSALQHHTARLAYVTPSHQFPLGGVMPMSRRQALVEWASKHNAYVIEDDYDSEYRYDVHPVPPLHGLESGERVIYLGTVSKTLSPALRLGYLVVPKALVAAFAAAKQLADRHTATAEQDALAALIEQGHYESHVRRVRRKNGERRLALLTALKAAFGEQVIIEGADAGLHIVAWFLQISRQQEAEVLEAAQCAGVGIYSIAPLLEPQNETQRANASDCSAGAAAWPAGMGLIMGYSALSPSAIEAGVAILSKVITDVLKRSR